MGICLLSNKFENMKLRAVESKDQALVKELVIGVLKEYGLTPDLNGVDQDLNDPKAFYEKAGAYFFVLENSKHEIVGVAALYPVSKTNIELRKMYFRKDYRGLGLGKKVLTHFSEFAKMKSFSKIELETASVLKEAIGLYKSFGFVVEDKQPAVGRCDISMSLEL